MQERSPAQIYALLFGVALVVAGIVGFFYNGTFTSNEAVHDDVLGVLSVNGWHNIVHVASGAIGLALVGSWAASRVYAYALGVVYIGVAIWGFIIGGDDSILGIVPINTADNVLHLLIGVAGIGAGVATAATRGRATARPVTS